MTTLNKLINRLRPKITDTEIKSYSRPELLDAINESIREIRKTVIQFYDHLKFTLPSVADLTEANDTGWPVDFDELIIEYATIVLLPSDYGTKEQAKILWKQKVLSLVSTMNDSVEFIDGCYGPRWRRHVKPEVGGR